MSLNMIQQFGCYCIGGCVVLSEPLYMLFSSVRHKTTSGCYNRWHHARVEERICAVRAAT